MALFIKEELHLKFKESACYFSNQQNGLSFLGARIFPGIIRVRPENLKRVRKKIVRKEAAWLTGNIEEEEFLMSMNSYWAYLSQFDTMNLRRQWVSIDPCVARG